MSTPYDERDKLLRAESRMTALEQERDALQAQRDKLLAIAQEIANAGSECDLGDSERRIRLYAAITKAGGQL